MKKEQVRLLEDSWVRATEFLNMPEKPVLRIKLQRAYQEAQRKYHTTQHLLECIDLFEKNFRLTEHPGEVEMAIWFHDAIYETQKNSPLSNEEQSALYAVDSLRCLKPESLDRISRMILSTSHSVKPATNDEKLLLDIDLSILGAHPNRFKEYEAQIREEYSFVEPSLFKEKRLEILKMFHAKEKIFNLHVFDMEFGNQAKENLAESIRQLEATDIAQAAHPYKSALQPREL